jgi:pimeloyl-ACP methyl ester carboxylesterase
MLGEAVLRTPMSRPVYRRLLRQGLSPAAAAAAPDDLLYALRLAARHPGNTRTVASLMRAIDGFRPRAGSIMTDRELGQITAPTMFCLATGDPFLSRHRRSCGPGAAEAIPDAALADGHAHNDMWWQPE